MGVLSRAPHSCVARRSSVPLCQHTLNDEPAAEDQRTKRGYKHRVNDRCTPPVPARATPGYTVCIRGFPLGTWPRRLMLAALVALSVSILSSCSSQSSPTPSSGTGTRSDSSTIGIVFTYGSEKQSWIEDTTAAFNQANHRTAGGKRIQVQAVPMGSGEVVDEILSGARQPDLISPASAAFIKLGNADSRTKTGKDLVGPTQNLVLSPVVIAMWQPMAEALGWGKRPLGWADVVSLTSKPEGWAAYGHPEWGRYRYGHTHPRASNSGLISLLAEAYAGAGKMSALTLDDVRRPETARFIEGAEQAIVHYGSSTGFFGRKMFANGPGYLSAAVLYESMV